MNTAPSFTNVKKEIVKWVYVGNEINILKRKLQKYNLKIFAICNYVVKTYTYKYVTVYGVGRKQGAFYGFQLLFET